MTEAKRSKWLRKTRRTLMVQSLESRRLLATDSLESVPSAAWFSLREEPGASHEIAKPADVTSDWIVHLRSEDVSKSPSLSNVQKLLNNSSISFQVVRGLGLPGLVQVRALASEATAQVALSRNPSVASFESNITFSGANFPNDSDFGSLVGLHNVGQFDGLVDADIDALEAWDQSTGSMSVVVGVIDSGIDATHPDIYRNIWINQGEIQKSLQSKLADIDQDHTITFEDLNSAVNANLVRDLNGNGYIDAIDLLSDPNWSDGIDTDGNGFIDDFFGWNFRSGVDESFAPNNPSDNLGHGTHVAGTIGARGNNAIGITGVNWQTSLMSLKFLDANNRGDVASAIAAINYATMMRTQFNTNVRVLNGSWGQSGSPNPLLRDTIRSAGDAGILYIAAAGNGNVLGQGVNNDRTPFYPASYDVGNIITVAASDALDRLASFSNFGATTVDLVAPGVGIRSTLPGGRYSDANGTSMATPLVSGTAALIWSILPNASVEEVRRAILESVDVRAELSGVVATSGRLNAFRAVNSTLFAPVAEVVAASDVSVAGGKSHEITVRYQDRKGLNPLSIGDDDLIVKRQWGLRESLGVRLKANSIQIQENGTVLIATYLLVPPGGDWDALDFGAYAIQSVAGAVLSQDPKSSIRSENIGTFNVQIADPAILYVGDQRDSLAANSLRSAILIANAQPGIARTIILGSGRFTIDIPYQADPNYPFLNAPVAHSCFAPEQQPIWSNATTGDLDILGNITIIGDSNATTLIDGQAFDRVFKVHPNATLNLRRVKVTGGVPAADQGGGGILSAGTLNLDQVVVQENIALGTNDSPARGGAIASWAGQVSVTNSRFSKNQSDVGGAVFLCGDSTAVISRSTLDNNLGGAFVSYSSQDSLIENSTLSSNFGGAVHSRSRDFPGGAGSSGRPSISRDGQTIAFLSNASNLVANDSNGVADAFVYRRATGEVTRASVSTTNQQANRQVVAPALSGDGTKAIFLSSANNLFTGDNLFSNDLFLRDFTNGTTAVVNQTQTTAREIRGTPSISDNGRFIVYQQSVSDDPNNGWGVFIRDTESGSLERINLTLNARAVDIALLDVTGISGDGRFVTIGSKISGSVDGNFHDILLYDRVTQTLSSPKLRSSPISSVNGSNYAPVLSFDGSKMVFVSDDTNLVAGDTNGVSDIFLYDRNSDIVTRISLDSFGRQANGSSTNPSISADGRFVAFESGASNLVIGDSNSVSDIFVRDLATGRVERVSIDNQGTEANGASGSPSISGDGRFIAFESEANNLDADPVGHRAEIGSLNRQVFVYDRQSQLIRGISAFSQPSSVRVAHSTLAFNAGDETVAGNIEVSDSLFAGNIVQFDMGSKSLSLGHNVLASVSKSSQLRSDDLLNRSSASLLGPFTEAEGSTPGYPLLLGNPAIGNGAIQSLGTLDQWNQTRQHPDIGGLEAVFASVRGTVFADLNLNRTKDVDEPALGDFRLFVDANGDGALQPDERRTQSSQTAGVDGAVGSFRFENLQPGVQKIRIVVPDTWDATADPMVRVTNGSVQGNGDSSLAVVSASGNTIAFVSTSSNFFPGDTPNPNLFLYSRNLQSITLIPVVGDQLVPLDILGEQEQFILYRSNAGVFLYDRQQNSVEAISVSNTGELANAHSDSASASQDGQWIAFSSFANNLVSSDMDNFADIFLFNRTTKTVISISKDAIGVQGNNDSENPTISRDGRFVTFVSDASNLVPNDTNGVSDIFVYDRIHRSIQRVSISNEGVQSNAFSYPPSMSDDGRFIVFQSLATNLVSNDVNATSDLFVFDRQNSSIEKLDIPFSTGTAVVSYSPKISVDGQYVVFNAFNSVLDTSDSTSQQSVYVYDRFVDSTNSDTPPRITRINRPFADLRSNGSSQRAIISNDSRWIFFESSANNLVANDTNQRNDLFVAPNPFETASQSLQLQGGQQRDSLDIGLVPKPGSIRGTIFEDIGSDESYDTGDPTLTNWTVYLDTNNNGRRDVGEESVMSQTDGSYLFDQLPSHREYVIRVEVPLGWSSSSSQPNSNAGNVFLTARGSIDQRNFGFRRQASTGQSQNARIQGRVFNDLNGDGLQQAGETGMPGTVVYLDLDGDERVDFDEPKNVTDSDGNYAFSNLGSRGYTVRIAPSEGIQLLSPAGNRFTASTKTFSSSSIPLSRPQDVAVADFDGRNGPDLAIVLYSGNSVSIQLNDGRGNFVNQPISANVEGGPVAIAAGNLNGRGSSELVTANSLNNTITILEDFEANGFAKTTKVNVGAIPYDIALADLDGDADLDIAVAVDSGNNFIGQVKILINDGTGKFTPGPTLATGGKRPVSIAAGDFNRDNIVDLALVNLGDPISGDIGNVSVILGRGRNSFQNATTYRVGLSPTSIDIGDLNNDGAIDLAVANFSSNTSSILQGNGSGSFIVVPDQLSLGNGPMQVSLVDIDNDRDLDILASNFSSRTISILRNRFSQERVSTLTSNSFEPSESFGVGQLSVGPRLTFATIDLDQSGTIDIAVVNSESNSINLLSNSLIGGAHRIQSTGTGTFANKNFGVNSIVLNPTLDPILAPETILEDASSLTLSLTGISRGRSSGPPLRLTASSSNPAVVGNPTINHVEGTASGQMSLTPLRDAVGTSTITIEIRNAGGDGVFGNADDGIVQRSFTISVLPVNDPPSTSLGSDQFIFQGRNLRVVSAFAKDFQPGGGDDERIQRIAEYLVLNDRTDLFIVQPNIDNEGNLRYQPALNRTGVATIRVQVRDNGGTEFNGNDRSAVQEFRITVQDFSSGSFDLGDAPTAAQSRFVTSYPTLLENDGPRHPVGDLFLGSAVDAERDGQPSSNATGDDAILDDEDGILFPITAFASANTPTISSFVAVASLKSKLDAWIDFNQDGDWVDSGEQILSSESMSEGRNLVSFTIPAGARVGTTFARFRLSSAGGLGVTGEAADGEVEDYALQIVDRQSIASLTLQASEIGPHELAILNGSLIVFAQGKAIFNAPAGDVPSVTALASSNSVAYQVLRPLVNLLGTVQYVGIGQPIVMSIAAANTNLSNVESGSLFGIGTLALAANIEQSLQFSESHIAALNTSKSVKIILGPSDKLITTSDWQLVNRVVEQGNLIHEFQKNDAKIRVQNSALWQNPINAFDTSGDGQLSALDVLLVISLLNLRREGTAVLLPVFDPSKPLESRFVDVDGNGTATPRDVLLIIERLTKSRSASGEGEGRVEALPTLETNRAVILMMPKSYAFLDDEADTLEGTGIHRSKRDIAAMRLRMGRPRV